MILPAQCILARLNLEADLSRRLEITPFSGRRVYEGMSYGLSSAGYDLRVKDEVVLHPGNFKLAVTIEYFSFPHDIMGMLVDKSTWARRGIAVQNTVFEPGWRGYPTIELSNHYGVSYRSERPRPVVIKAGSPIGQMLFMQLSEPTVQPYSGKYQDQPQKPIEAKSE